MPRMSFTLSDAVLAADHNTAGALLLPLCLYELFIILANVVANVYLQETSVHLL